MRDVKIRLFIVLRHFQRPCHPVVWNPLIDNFLKINCGRRQSHEFTEIRATDT